ncbi:hypothetical protein [Cetobacterium sp.]|uniref:hypothetical protein n=1 Tax=Cetobacterium sp. TaxID=2071632 RepID=UPI003F3179CD
MEELKNEIAEKLELLKSMGVKKGDICIKLGMTRQALHKVQKTAKFRDTLIKLSKQLDMIIKYYSK